jgi:penicillin-binding protein 1A
VDKIHLDEPSSCSSRSCISIFCISQGFLGDMPDVQELENPDIYVASQIISSDGVELGKFEKEKTIPITYKDLPPHLVYALMAKEDERFREHSGIDLQAF